MVDKKFGAVPVEPDTRVLSRKHCLVGGYEALHERWVWDGIHGETVVFVSSEVCHLEDDQLRALITASEFFHTGTPTTVKRSETGYTLVNFNFTY